MIHREAGITQYSISIYWVPGGSSQMFAFPEIQSSLVNLTKLTHGLIRSDGWSLTSKTTDMFTIDKPVFHIYSVRAAGNGRICWVCPENMRAPSAGHVDNWGAHLCVAIATDYVSSKTFQLLLNLSLHTVICHFQFEDISSLVCNNTNTNFPSGMCWILIHLKDRYYSIQERVLEFKHRHSG